MTSSTFERSLANIGRYQIVLRVAVVLGALVMVTATRLAAGDAEPAIDAAVMGLAIVCSIVPDTHLGLAVIVIGWIGWIVTVDDPTTPWAIGMAVGTVAFHAATAAATIAPLTASLAPRTMRRWTLRSAVAATSAVPVWLAVIVADRLAPDANATTAAIALFVIAGGANFARYGLRSRRAGDARVRNDPT